MQSHIEVVVTDEIAQEVISRHECATDDEARRIAAQKAGSYTATIYEVYADRHRHVIEK